MFLRKGAVSGTEALVPIAPACSAAEQPNLALHCIQLLWIGWNFVRPNGVSTSYHTRGGQGELTRLGPRTRLHSATVLQSNMQMRRSPDIREIVEALDFARRELMRRGSPDFLRARVGEDRVQELCRRLLRQTTSTTQTQRHSRHRAIS